MALLDIGRPLAGETFAVAVAAARAQVGGWVAARTPNALPPGRDRLGPREGKNIGKLVIPVAAE